MMDFSEKAENDMLPQGIDVVATADFAGKGLRKLDRCEEGAYQSLILDKNDFNRLENVDTFGELYKLSAADNKLVRMYAVSRLVHLRVLNLARNNIVAVEGLRDLVHLRWLNLSANKIKVLEHLTSNTSLEFIDVSRNMITTLTDISNLIFLRTLLLDHNNLRTLGNTSHCLPRSLVNLSVTNNSIADLNQVSSLATLTDLQQFSISNNPCVAMTGNSVGFDYRPFIINWCQNLKLLDGYVIGSKESLKAEWLYSMGKGRHFQLGEHAELVEYLSNVCPLTYADTAMSAEDAKLTRILGKRRQHQQQLLAEQSAMTSSVMTTSAPADYAGVAVVERPSTKARPSDSLPEDGNDQMAAAARPSGEGLPSDIPDAELGHEPERMTPLHADTQYVPVPETLLLSPRDVRPPDDLMSMSCESVLPRWLQRTAIPRKASPPPAAASRCRRPSQTDSPVLRRPTQVQRMQQRSKNRPLSLSPTANRRPNSAEKLANDKSDGSGTDSDSVPVSQLALVKVAVQQRLHGSEKKTKSKEHHVPVAADAVAATAVGAPITVESRCVDKSEESMKRVRAATVIQAAWRGHDARHKESMAGGVRREIRVRRTEDHVRHLMDTLAATQRELENEKKLRKLQMEAIRSLWNEVQQMQSTGSDPSVTMPKVNDNTSDMIAHLAATCEILQSQVQELQNALHIVSSKGMPDEGQPSGSKSTSEADANSHAITDPAPDHSLMNGTNADSPIEDPEVADTENPKSKLV